ncbi:hypothetical protein BCR44DRAFT_1430918 [Catenaria anguillulae PL171]|uniref:Uncharacterized protein n=1 Tax=Catenaria anguillulae PL171 TaxID=765915 RepID=A0A1Y2HRU8_9FUNG|nr:hypothetical protein BCR44DRAFT_1430918 [Catenaria anguillulae PL171]
MIDGYALDARSRGASFPGFVCLFRFVNMVGICVPCFGIVNWLKLLPSTRTGKNTDGWII